ncbi:MAG: hypothetical protein HYV32_06835 [Candidatus Kerfeldbacteria bacterium]|nr:hypothetical protein [Candidatus Kerfeldbacteria bacterium]
MSIVSDIKKYKFRFIPFLIPLTLFTIAWRNEKYDHTLTPISFAILFPLMFFFPLIDYLKKRKMKK